MLSNVFWTCSYWDLAREILREFCFATKKLNDLYHSGFQKTDPSLRIFYSSNDFNYPRASTSTSLFWELDIDLKSIFCYQKN